ncbi:MAG: YicC family protein [Betaproteobacteria bacterium]|nr:YicC family protein [Betaproteobacteria bacterium]
MIHSMTGYATVARELPQGAVQLELRSVNSRFLDIGFRIPDEFRAVEAQFRELISARIGRGKVDCRLSYTLRPLADEKIAVDQTALERLARLATEVRRVMPDVQPMRVSEVISWPGIIADSAATSDALRGEGVALLRAALDELTATREREGAKLGETITQRTRQMRTRLSTLEPIIPQAIAAYQEKLASKLREALSTQDDDRIRQEIAVFGVRIDVAEELSRLSAHLDEVERVLAKGGAVGKRLDFLMQELNREANTLGSKSVARELSEAAVEFKLSIEQIREQVQNLE